MYERILVPLDGSELAEVALPYAEELAGRLGSEVNLIYARAPAENPYNPMHQSYLQKMVEYTKDGVERSFGKAIKVGSAVVGSAILVGHPAEEIVDYADKEGIGLIVMTTHGRSGIRRWALGSVADKVVRATRRPVVLIRAKGSRPDVSEKGILNKALVPLDGSRESEAVIPYIEELASKLKTEVVLFQVVAPAYLVYSIPGEVVSQPHSPEELEKIMTKSKDYLDTVGAELRDKGINTRSEVGVGVPAEEIIRIADEIQANVVAMSSHGHSGISRWTFGSTAEKVLHAGNAPLLLVRAQGANQGNEMRGACADPTSISSLIADLGSKDGLVRVKARRSLVAIGRQAVDPLVEALANRKEWVRWEAAKALGQIGDPAATQALVKALEDEMFDVRWLAAEGLAAIGREALVPLLQALMEHSDSLWLREGAHHVLLDLDRGKLGKVLRPVLAALENTEPAVEVPFAAETALHALTRAKDKRGSQ